MPKQPESMLHPLEFVELVNDLIRGINLDIYGGASCIGTMWAAKGNCHKCLKTSISYQYSTLVTSYLFHSKRKITRIKCICCIALRDICISVLEHCVQMFTTHLSFLPSSSGCSVDNYHFNELNVKRLGS